jgi:hypothetical protein
MARKRKYKGDPELWTDAQKTAMNEVLGSKPFIDLRNTGENGSGGSSGSTGSKDNVRTDAGVTNSYVRAGADPTDPASVQIPYSGPAVNSSWSDWAKYGTQPTTPPRTPQPDVTAGQPFASSSGRSIETLRNNPSGSANAELASRIAAASGTIDAIVKDPDKWVEEQTASLNVDQSLVDKGMDLMGRLFNYQDESDLQILGLNLSTVESVADTFTRYMVGSRNVLDTAITAAISAAPGGVQTMEWGQITDNHDLGSVLHGDIGMLDNNGPSPMQTAIASVAIEAKRIREGDARLSDILLLNPATAPFILAGMAAEDSPLQKKDFNLLDPGQRKAAFGEGWEKYMSGLGDFGVQMAAPSMAAAGGAKLAFMGVLGTTWKGATGAVMARPAFDRATDLVMKASFDDAVKNGQIPAGAAPTVADRTFANASMTNRRIRAKMLSAQMQPLAVQFQAPLNIDGADAVDFFKELSDRGLTGGRSAEEAAAAYQKGKKTAELTPDEKVVDLPQSAKDEIDFANDLDEMFTPWQAGKINDAAKARGMDVEKDIKAIIEPTYVTKSSDELGLTDPLARFINDVAQKNRETGVPVMSRAEIEGRKEIRNNPHKAQISSLLHALDDPYMIGVVMRSMHNDREALELLHQTAASLYDTVYRLRVSQTMNAGKFDGAKIEAVKASLDLQEKALERQLTQRTALLAKGGEEIAKDTRVMNLEDSIAEIKALKAHFDGQPIDLMAPGPFHDAVYTERVLRDMEIRADAYQRLVRDDLDYVLRNSMFDSDRDSRFILNDNWGARMVSKSREKKARTRYEYLTDGSLFSRRMKVDKIDTVKEGPNKGKMAHRIDRGWVIRDFANPTQWGNTGRRAARVWRWYGAETPSGWLGLKGAATSTSMDELTAALDLDAYYGPPTLVTYINDAGETVVDEAVGGAARRQQLLDIWAGALADNRIDLKSVAVHIENEITKDMGRIYGQSTEAMQKYRKGVDASKANHEQQMQKHGMFVDADGTVNHVPWMKHQLANGHMMDNWHAVEHMLQKIALDNYGAQAGTVSRNFAKAGGQAAGASRAFIGAGQRLWRPFVLLRAAFPVRNNVEGIGRAMGYYASLAPLAWPAQAAYYGTKSRVAARRAEAISSGIVETVTSAPGYRAAREEFIAANKEHVYLKTGALTTFEKDEWQRMIDLKEIEGPMAGLDPSVPRRYLYKRNAEGKKIEEALSPDEFDRRLAAAEQRLANAHAGQAEIEAAFTKELGDSKFGKYREKQLKAYDDEIKAVCAKRGLLNSASVGAGGAGSLGVLEGLAFLAEREIQMRAASDILRYDPVGAAAMFKSDAKRLNSMGGGTSLGPGGGSYSNAFDDPFVEFNKGLVSADVSRKMQLGAESDFWTNTFLQTLTTRNDVIPFSEASRGEWTAGMAQMINQNAYNPLVHEMLRDVYDDKGRVIGYGNLDWERGVHWMLTTPEGRKFMDQQRKLEGSDFGVEDTWMEDIQTPKGMSTIEGRSIQSVFTKQKRMDPETLMPTTVDVKVAERLRKTSQEERNMVTGFLDELDDFEAATTYAQRVALSLRWQYQDMPEFLSLLKQKSQSISNNFVYEVTAKDIDDVISGFTPAQRNALGAVRGDTAIQVGESTFTQKYTKAVSWLFHAIGTVPEDAITRMPFYNKRFKQTRNNLIESYIAQEHPGVKVSRKVFDRAGKEVDEGIRLSQDIEVPTRELEGIYAAAHAQALHDTRTYLYTVERRTNLGKHAEYISPFISAQQNTFVALGKLAWRNPWQVPLVANLWTMPYQNGVVDENGNLRVTMPATWLAQEAGVIIPSQYTTIAMNALNVWTPDSGFMGVVPRPGPMITWTASEVMKKSIAGITTSTPETLVALFGKEKADESWGLLKDYIFGEGFGVSSRTLSYDVWVPPYLRYILDAHDEFSDAYARNYMLEAAQRTLIAQANGLPEPTPDEIGAATTNKMLFYAAGAYGLTGGVGRLDIKSPIAEAAMEVLQKYMKAQGELNPDGTYKLGPGQAYSAFEAMVGPDVMRVAISAMTDNVGGAGKYDDTVADIKALDPLIRKLVGVDSPLGGKMEILDILVNNNVAGDDYSSDAARWLAESNIGSSSEPWLSKRSGTDALLNADVTVGWTEYQKFDHEQQALMFDMGVDNVQQSAAAPLREKKRIWLANMRQSNPAWYEDYADGAEKRINAVVSTLETAVEDETFVKRMMDTGNADLVASMRAYVYERRQMVIAQEESGYTWGSPINQPLREAWATRQKELADGNMRWGEIFTRWLNNDEEPVAAGNMNISTQELEVASNG